VRFLLGTLALVFSAAALATAQLPDASPSEPDYSNAVPTDAVARLQQKIAAGDVRLAFDRQAIRFS
jgi:hypothetical protein